MAEIKLANGQVALLVDEADLPKVSRWKWHVGGGYARRTGCRTICRGPATGPRAASFRSALAGTKGAAICSVQN